MRMCLIVASLDARLGEEESVCMGRWGVKKMELEVKSMRKFLSIEDNQEYLLTACCPLLVAKVRFRNKPLPVPFLVGAVRQIQGPRGSALEPLHTVVISYGNTTVTDAT